MRERIASLPLAVEILLVNAICFALPIAGSVMALASETRTFRITNAEALWTVAIELVSLGLAASILLARGWRFADLHVVPTVPMTLGGLGLFVIYILFAGILGALFQSAGMPLVPVTFEVTAAASIIVLFSLVNAFFEESVLIGYNLRAFSAEGAALAISLSGFIRFVYHAYQGPYGASAALLFGLLSGAVYWRWKRLWPVVFAHATVDVVSLTQV